MENSDISTESSGKNPNGTRNNAGDLHQKDELHVNSQTEATQEQEVKSVPHKNRSKAATTEDKKEGNEKSNENQRSPEDLSKITPPSRHQTLALSKLLDSVFLDHGLSPEEDLPLRDEIAKDVHKAVCTKFPECRVLPYGSSLTGFGLKDSDVNLDLVIPEELNVPCVLLSILELIQNDDKYCDVKSESGAEVPRILFKHLSSGLLCKLSAGNISASRTSCLLKKYRDADSRVHKLVVGLRYWARSCSIDCQSEGGLPGYSVALMVIQFLQVTKPPVLPTWVPQEAIDEVNQKAAENFVSENQEEIGTLWYQLFRFYCIDFDLSNLVISIKDPRPVKKEDKTWSHRRIAIEDPFSTERNVASSLRSDRANDYFFTCWVNSFRYFTSSPQNGSNTEIRNTNSKPPHKKNDSKSVKTEKQESKAASVDEDIFQMDDLDPLTKQMRSMDVSSNDCEDGGFSQRQTKKKDSSLKSKAQDDAEIEVEISLSGSKEDDDRNSKTDSEEQACGVADKSKDIVYRFDTKIFQGNSKPVKTCCLCKEDGHVKDQCPDLQKPPLIALPPMTPMFAKVLDSFCQTCRADFELEKSEVSNREKVLRKLESYINKQYPGARLFLFGSSKNGFGFHKSDMDICMTLEGYVKEEVKCVKVIRRLAKHLRKHGDCGNVLAINKGKVPKVEFFLHSRKLEADISLYNTLALENTKMLATYAKLDDRVATLGYTVKVFAKVNDIGDASKGSLSSYAYILMLLHYLQQCKPPVIPVLQALHKDEKPPEKIIEGWNCWFLSDEKKIRSAWNPKERNSFSVGLLWYGFLRYYTEEFDFEHDVVCCRKTEKLTKFEKMWTKPVFAIEDPFNLDHNLGANVTEKKAYYIQTTFIRGRERFGFPQFFQALSDSERGKLGHITKGCPLAKPNRHAEERKEREERKLEKEAGEKMNVKQMPFGAGSVRPRSASAPSKEGLNKNVDDSMHLPSTPSRQGANASDVTPLLKSQADSQDLLSPPKGSRGIQSRGVADKLYEVPNMKTPDETLLQGSPSVHSATPETLMESKEGISQPIKTSHIFVAPGESMPQSQGNSLQHTIGTHMTGEQFISLFRAAEEEIKKEDIPPTNPPANDEFESKDLHIAPKNLKAAKTPKEHQLLSKLSKVKSLWKGNATAEMQSCCSAPVPVKELNPSGHTEVQESDDAIASFQDTEVTVKEETCTTVTENVIRKKDEGMMVDKVDSTESVSEKPNGTAPSTQGHNEVASRRVSTEEQNLSTHEVTLKGKSEASATTVDKGERKRAEEEEEPIATSATQADAPRKKNARRGGRGRKAKTQRQNEVIESPLNEQEKTGDDGTKERKNTQVQNQRQKNRVDFKVDASKDSPSSSSKRLGSELAEEKQSGSSREGPRHGAESSRNSTPKKLGYERSKVKPTDSSRDPFGRGADSIQISTPKRPRSKRPKEKPSESSRDFPRRDAESNKNTRRGSERSESKSNESSIDDSRRGAEPSQMSTPQKPRSERSEERSSQSPGDDPHRGAESTLSSNKHKESSSSKKEPGKRAPHETKKDPEKRAPQETKKEPGKGAPQETKKDPEKRAPQETKKEPGKEAPQETKKDPEKRA